MPRGRPENAASDTATAKATKPQKANGNGANLGFEAQLFLAADKLRKNLEAWASCDPLGSQRAGPDGPFAPPARRRHHHRLSEQAAESSRCKRSAASAPRVDPLIGNQGLLG